MKKSKRIENLHLKKHSLIKLKRRGGRQHEIEKLKVSQEGGVISLTSRHGERSPIILLKNVIPKFDCKNSDMSLFILFQRQAEKAKINQNDCGDKSLRPISRKNC